MGVRWLLSWLILAPLLVQPLSIVKPRGLTAPPEGNNNESDVCQEYKVCSQKGLGYWNTLQTTLFEAKAADRNDKAIFDQYYHSAFGYSDYPAAVLQQSLINRGIEVAKMDYWGTSSVDPETGFEEYAAYFNHFDTQNGILIADANYRDEDSQKKLPWSELMYQTWGLAQQTSNADAARDKSVAPGGPISNVRAVVRREVVKKGTRAVISTVYKANGLVPGADGPEGWQKWTEEDHQDFFFGLLGTDNIKGVVWLLNDHAAEIGKKEVSAIWTRWCPDIPPDIWCVEGLISPMILAVPLTLVETQD